MSSADLVHANSFGLLIHMGPLVGTIISGVQYLAYASPKPKIGELLIRSFKDFGWNLIVNATSVFSVHFC